jgi:hypothetical protein
MEGTAGMTEAPEFNRWYSMVQRCHNPKATGYEYYGARGIAVYDRWRYGALLK